MRGQLWIDGINITQAFGVYISGTGVHGAPARSVTLTTVPGKNGQLVIDNGRFENIVVTYAASFINRDFSENIEHLRNFLHSKKGYRRISDSYHSDEYRMGVYIGPFNPSVQKHLTSGQFDLAFNCKPQRFLVDPPAVTFTATGTIYNPELMDARPLVRAYGTGQIGINGTYIDILDNTSYTDIDCDLMEAFEGTTNRNYDIKINGSGDFPVLGPGVNNIVVGTGISSVVITPRWWRL